MGDLEAQLRLLLVSHLRRELRRVAQSSLHDFSRARGTNARSQKQTKVTKFHCSVLGQGLRLLRYLLFKVSSTGLPSLIVQGERKQKSSFRLAAGAPQREVRLRGTRKVRAGPALHATLARYPHKNGSAGSRRRLILFYGRNSGEYRLVIGDCVICLGAKIEFSRGCVVVLALTSAAFGQDTIPISRTNRSILQPEEEAQIEQPSGFIVADHMTGDWGGLRKRFFTAGVEVFAFDNSIFNG